MTPEQLATQDNTSTGSAINSQQQSQQVPLINNQIRLRKLQSVDGGSLSLSRLQFRSDMRYWSWVLVMSCPSCPVSHAKFVRRVQNWSYCECLCCQVLKYWLVIWLVLNKKTLGTLVRSGQVSLGTQIQSLTQTSPIIVRVTSLACVPQTMSAQQTG